MSENLGRPPVEDMSDVQWARVERNVFGRLNEGTITTAAAAREVSKKADRRTTWVWLAVPSAAAAAFALAFFSMNNPSGPTAIDEPSRVVAGSSPSRVSFGEAHVTLDANAAVVMDQKAGKPTALLENGAAQFTVGRRDDHRPFTVLAGDATIRANEGDFRVARDGERATVTVSSGSVEIRFRGREVHVDAHHTWSSEDQLVR